MLFRFDTLILIFMYLKVQLYSESKIFTRDRYSIHVTASSGNKLHAAIAGNARN
jgi:hypothetical protein